MRILTILDSHMKIRTFSKLALIASLLLPSALFAAIPFENYESIVVPQYRKYPNYGFYYSVHLGVNNVSSFDLSPEADDDVTIVPDAKIELDPGFMGGGALGFRNKNFRSEAEISVRFNSTDKVTELPSCGLPQSITSDGDVIVGSLLFNFYWDWLMGSHFVPFVGAGVGGAFVSNNVSAEVFDITDPMSPVSLGKPEFSENGFGLAWQLIAGIGLILNDHSEIDLVFKFFQAKPGKYSNKTYLDDCAVMDPMPIEIEFAPTYTAETLALEWRIHP